MADELLNEPDEPVVITNETPKPAPVVEEPVVVEGEEPAEVAPVVEGEPVAETPPAEDKAKSAKPFRERIGQLTRQKKEFETRATTAEAEAQTLRQMLESLTAGGSEEPAEGTAPVTPKPSKVPTQAEIEKAIREQAQRIVTQERAQERATTWLANGKKDYADFDERCNLLADLGAENKPEFMEVVTSMSDGHKVVAELANNPDEASRIFNLPPLAMAAELARFGMAVAAPKVKALSNAPKPITPISGVAKGNEMPTDDDSEAEWFRKEELRMRGKVRGAKF